MVDWEAVERLRGRGWEWGRIASDPSVGFGPEDDSDPGATLRARYYRRSRSPGASTADGTVPDPAGTQPTRRDRLVRAGFLLAPLFGVWALLAEVAPSPVGAYLPAVPILGLVFAGTGILLLLGLRHRTDRWTPVHRRALVFGVVLGLAVAGTLGGVAYAEGCPYLTPLTSGEPGSWVRAANPMWESGGAPVLFFYGSVACPYCSASSWAIEAALIKFGSLTGTSFGQSSSSDVFPGTPEVVLAAAQYHGSYVALDAREGTDFSQITTPAPGACIEQGYLSAYDPFGTIPFVAVGGVFVHLSTLVDPGALAGVPPSSLQGQVLNESGPQWGAIAPAAFLLMAFLVHLNGGQPAAVAQLPPVAADLSTI